MFSLAVHASALLSHLIASSITILVTILLLAALVALALMALSRHKKSGTGPIQLLGAEGLVQAELRPEGAVLIKGELWRAPAELQESRTPLFQEGARTRRKAGLYQGIHSAWRPEVWAKAVCSGEGYRRMLFWGSAQADAHGQRHFYQ